MRHFLLVPLLALAGCGLFPASDERPGPVTGSVTGPSAPQPATGIAPAVSTTALGVLAIPMFMVVLSMTLPARVNRTVNLVVASLLVPFTIYNLSGGFYLYFYGLGVVLELILLALIWRFAWTWPRTAPSATSPDGESVRAQRQA